MISVNCRSSAKLLLHLYTTYKYSAITLTSKLAGLAIVRGELVNMVAILPLLCHNLVDFLNDFMDQAPRPGMPEEPQMPAERTRRRRFLRRFRGLGSHEAVPGVADVAADMITAVVSPFELGQENRADSQEAAEDHDPATPRLQRLGRNVLSQTHEVYGLAESLTGSVNDLPPASREVVKPEADRLQTASGELQDAAEELDEELDSLDSTLGPETSTDVASVAPERSEPAEHKVEKPKKDHSEVMAMARLVIATLIGGGLGALVGGEGNKKEHGKPAPKPESKPAPSVEDQELKLAAQEAELQKLRAAKPEGPIQKEYVKQAGDLVEKQTELTQTTVEQVRAAAMQAAESEKTFKIPELQKPTAEVRVAETEAGERFEQLHEHSGEHHDNRGSETSSRDWQPPVNSTEQTHVAQPQQSNVFQPQQVPSKNINKSSTWVYWALLAGAGAVALGLLFFGPK